MDKSLENKRQAVEPYEPVCLVSVTFLYRFSWTGFFPVFQRCTMGRNAAGISLCGCDHSDSIAFAETGAGFYIKEEIVEHIADSIRQTAAAGSHFSGMLTPEEDEIMREIIREFMK